MDKNQHDILRKRLIFQSNHRGCKEMDLVMGQFCMRHVPAMSEAQLAIYEDLLQEDDLEIWDWLVGRTPIADARYATLIEQMRQFTPATKL